MILYRGENWDCWMQIQRDNFVKPKGHKFEIMFNHNGKIDYDGSATYGSSIQNAVNGHQISSKNFTTSGISFSPIWERALIYALNNNKYKSGVILEFETNEILDNSIELFDVNKMINHPTFREDNEFIIKRRDNQVFPLSMFKVHEIKI
jgi:hypothetical protein